MPPRRAGSRNRGAGRGGGTAGSEVHPRGDDGQKCDLAPAGTAWPKNSVMIDYLSSLGQNMSGRPPVAYSLKARILAWHHLDVTVDDAETPPQMLKDWVETRPSQANVATDASSRQARLANVLEVFSAANAAESTRRKFSDTFDKYEKLFAEAAAEIPDPDLRASQYRQMAAIAANQMSAADQITNEPINDFLNAKYYTERVTTMLPIIQAGGHPAGATSLSSRQRGKQSADAATDDQPDGGNAAGTGGGGDGGQGGSGGPLQGSSGVGGTGGDGQGSGQT